MSEENRVSDERLAEMLLVIGEPVEQLSISLPSTDLHLALTELQSLRSKPVAGVEVKPLAWEGQTAIDAFGLRWTVYMDYGREDGKECFACNCIDGTWPTVEEAKAAAQADYRQRILSTLSLPAQEPVAYRVRMDRPFGGVWQLRHVLHDWEKWDIVVPLYASPQPTVITEEMVERAHAAYAKTVGGTLDGQPMRNALTAAMVHP